MIRTAVAVLLCSSVSSYALSLPEPGKADTHVRLQPYDPLNRTMLVLTVSRVSNIMFSPMEMIKRVIFGDENGPVATITEKVGGPAPLVNNLPLFGKAVGKTDLIVITASPDGKEHPYQFFLDVRPTPKDGNDDPEAVYGLQFTYVAQEKVAAQQEARQTWKEKQDAKMKEVAENRLNTDVFYGPQNWRYMAQGQFRDIAPIEAHDNGRITAFRYPGSMPVPSVFVVSNGQQRIADACTTGKPSKQDSEGTERVPQTTHMDDMVLVQQTAPHMRLRSGDPVVEIYNCGWDAIGVNPGTGTSSPEVVRRVISTK
jgi:type IV secretion system protein VirB9